MAVGVVMRVLFYWVFLRTVLCGLIYCVVRIEYVFFYFFLSLFGLIGGIASWVVLLLGGE